MLVFRKILHTYYMNDPLYQPIRKQRGKFTFHQSLNAAYHFSVRILHYYFDQILLLCIHCSRYMFSKICAP